MAEAAIPAGETMMDTDSVSKQTYEDAKKLAEDRGSELAAAKAALEVYQQRGRSQLKAMSAAFEPEVKACYDDAAPEDKADFNSMLDWTRGCHERPNVEQQLPLGKLIHSFASKLKRTREDASVQSATAEQLASALKENEALKAENGTQARRIGELDTSLKEITENSAKLQTQLEKAGSLSEKFDFSKTASREADAEPVGETATTPAVSVVTENASRGKAPFVMDAGAALFSFINANSSASSSRFTPSGNNHALLGAAVGEGSGVRL
jgi:DNA repair exonuclease SbcCD ATPase subunit